MPVASGCVWQTRSQAGTRSTPLTLYKHPSDHDWNEFTALEDDLRRVVQVAQRGIGQAHGAHCEECDDHVGFPWYPGQQGDQMKSNLHL